MAGESLFLVQLISSPVLLPGGGGFQAILDSTIKSVEELLTLVCQSVERAMVLLLKAIFVSLLLIMIEAGGR